MLSPLRDRPADILPLTTHFLRLTAAHGGPSRVLNASAETRLSRQAWPGNVRELRNAMEPVAALVRGAQITDDDLAFLAAPVRALAASDVSTALLVLKLPVAIERFERASIERALSVSAGNRAEAARTLGISRQSLYTKLAGYKLG